MSIKVYKRPTTPCNSRGATGMLPAFKVEIGALFEGIQIDLETLEQVGQSTVVWRVEGSSY